MEMQSFIVPNVTGLTTQDLEVLSQVSIFSNPPDAERVTLKKRPVSLSSKYSNDTNTTPFNDSLQQKKSKFNLISKKYNAYINGDWSIIMIVL